MPSANTRSRRIPYLSGKGSYVRKNGDFVIQSLRDEINTDGIQYTESEGHPFHTSKVKGRVDLGGPFFTTKSYVESGLNKAQLRYVNGFTGISYEYEGVLSPTYPTASISNLFPTSIHSSIDELDEDGATAISRCKPTNSVADVATFLGELLKDGLPSFVGSQFWSDRSLRGASDEYLNAQFGLRPAINDAKKFAHGVIHADEVISQYERDAGRVVRRSFDFPIERSKKSETLATGSSAVPWGAPDTNGIFWENGTSDPSARLTRLVETYRRKWFRGAFTYTLPFGLDSRTTMGELALRAKVLGLEPSLDTLWEVAPWSWAVDWFTNTGDVVSNFQDFVIGGLVMPYGYMMEHTIVKHTYTLRYNGFSPGVQAVVAPLVLVTETKQRRQANPFGFGVTWDGLSSFQTSILAALGISKRGR